MANNPQTPSPEYPPATFKRRALAYTVHMVTASGAVWGLLSILAIYQGQWKLLFLWQALALIADGYDGYLARAWKTKVYAAAIDGALMDNILDYMNYVLIGALVALKAELMPNQVLGLLAGAMMMVSSAFQFSQVQAKEDLATGEHYYRGFPSVWNILVLYLLLLNFNPWLNFFVVTACAVLVFVPVKFIYPSRTGFYPLVNVININIWALTGLVMLVLYPNIPGWLTTINIIGCLIYLGMSLVATLRKPQPAGHPAAG